MYAKKNRKNKILSYLSYFLEKFMTHHRIRNLYDTFLELTFNLLILKILKDVKE